MDEVVEEEEEEEEEEEDEGRGVAVSAFFVGFVASSPVLPAGTTGWLEGGLAPCTRDRKSTAASAS